MFFPCGKADMSKNSMAARNLAIEITGLPFNPYVWWNFHPRLLMVLTFPTLGKGESSFKRALGWDVLVAPPVSLSAILFIVQKSLQTRGFPKIVGFPPNHPFVHRVFHYKPSIMGYHYFWKPPPVDMVRIPHYLQAFYTSQMIRWWRISSINSRIHGASIFPCYK